MLVHVLQVVRPSYVLFNFSLLLLKGMETIKHHFCHFRYIFQPFVTLFQVFKQCICLLPGDLTHLFKNSVLYGDDLRVVSCKAVQQTVVVAVYLKWAVNLLYKIVLGYVYCS